MGHTTLKTQRDRGFIGKPCEVISPGVDTETFKPDPAGRAWLNQRFGWDTEPIPVVGYAGRFVEEKGVPVLMSVLDGLDTPWRAIFVGGGPLERRLQDWASRYGDRVKIVTGIDHSAMPQYYNAMDVLCVPSQSTPRWREQFGRVIIEAFACGVPVIGSDSGEIPFVIDEVGRVVGERDVCGWISTLKTLLNDPAERRRRGEFSRDLAVTRHSHPVVAGRYLEFFERILASPSD
jgi:phosphatidyl-myo-inositol dimannoside synthase